jgi:hypothetical protein
MTVRHSVKNSYFTRIVLYGLIAIIHEITMKIFGNYFTNQKKKFG